MKAFLELLGRVSLSLVFLAALVNKIMNWEGAHTSLVDHLCLWQRSVAHPEIQKFMTSIFPMTPTLLLVAAFVEGVGGFLIFLGMRVRMGAGLLLLFLIPTTLVFHPFWMVPPQEQQLQIAMFLKNLSIMGGLLLLLAYGRGGESKASKPE
jgi:putative oxidoreductase